MLNTLPRDLLLVVFSLLDVPGLGAVCRACKCFSDLVGETLWKRLRRGMGYLTMDGCTEKESLRRQWLARKVCFGALAYEKSEPISTRGSPGGERTLLTEGANAGGLLL